MRTFLYLFVALPLLCACARGPAYGPKTPTSEDDRAAGSGAAAAPRPPLAAEEVTAQERLGQSLSHLSGKIGERNPNKPWELADAADYFAAELEGMGYALERQGYESGEVVLHNLIATSPGGAGGEQVILVAAHYDSPPGDPGRNAGGSAAVAVLELARAFANSQKARTLRFCLFGLGESPHGDGPARGARVYGESLLKRRQAAEAELQQDADAKASGSLPASLPQPAVDRSRVVAVILLDRLLQFDTAVEGKSEHVQVHLSSGPGAEAYVNALADNLSTPPLLVLRARLDAAAVESDASYWLSQDIPVVVVHGDGKARAQAAASASEDLDALTRVVFGLRSALREAAGAEPAAGDPFMQ